MAEPVKTLLLKAIENGIKTITGINQVIRNPSKPIDRDTANYDIAFVFDDRSEKTRRNRIAMNSFPLHIEIWIQGTSGQAISDKADIYEAAIHAMLETDSAIKAKMMTLIEESAEKFFVDELLGGIILLSKVTYAHAWGDAYNAVR